jgi:hypothetical protein
MTWESGPAFPPGTLVLSPEQAERLREALTLLAESFRAYADAWAALAPRLAETIGASLSAPVPTLDEVSTVHLRVIPSDADMRAAALANPEGTRDLLSWLTRSED